MVIPMNRIRRMEVDIRGDTRDHVCESRTQRPHHSDFAFRPVDILCNSLEQLLTVKDPRGLQLTSCIYDAWPSRLEAVLIALKGLRRQLIGVGMEVSVTCGLSTALEHYPQNLDAYFNLSIE